MINFRYRLNRYFLRNGPFWKSVFLKSWCYILHRVAKGWKQLLNTSEWTVFQSYYLISRSIFNTVLNGSPYHLTTDACRYANYQEHCFPVTIFKNWRLRKFLVDSYHSKLTYFTCGRNFDEKFSWDF